MVAARLQDADLTTASSRARNRITAVDIAQALERTVGGRTVSCDAAPQGATVTHIDNSTNFNVNGDNNTVSGNTIGGQQLTVHSS